MKGEYIAGIWGKKTANSIPNSIINTQSSICVPAQKEWGGKYGGIITFTMLDIDLSTVKKSYFFDKKSLQINSL